MRYVFKNGRWRKARLLSLRSGFGDGFGYGDGDGRGDGTGGGQGWKA